MNQAYADAAHLFSRAGFGAVHDEVLAHHTRPWPELVDLVLDVDRAPASPPGPDLSPDRGYSDRWIDMLHYWLNLARRPVDQAPIVEKMVLFWHGLLCSSLDKLHDHRILFEQNQAFRSLGLGSYRTLLHTVCRGPAMLRYLDNHRNVVGRPNENFARELMELFVTGEGHYTEHDVRESARAWTGHGAERGGDYRFDADDHDWGTKTFLGRTGNFDGPDIIDLLLGQRRTAHARFMSMRLWSFFAYPVAVDDPVVGDVMAAYRPALDIRDAVRAIFLHPQFRSDRARTGLVRSPFEYTVVVMRHTGFGPDQARPEWFLEPMGQKPFFPPDVSGWRQNRYWITTTAAWAKTRLASRLRWKAYHRDDLADVHEIVDRDPLRFKYTPDQAVDQALANYGIGPIGAASRQRLIDYINSERNSTERWGERAGLLMLPLLLPEVQMA